MGQSRSNIAFARLEHLFQYDENDPDDRRKSQVLMMAKLDEIERVSVPLLCPASNFFADLST